MRKKIVDPDLVASLRTKRFVLRRHEDVTGVSGTGIVAIGVVFKDGKCSMQWNTPVRSICIYDSIDDLMKIHGHDGATVLVWID